MLATTDPGGAPRAVLFRIEEPSGHRLYVFPYAPGTTNDPWLMDGYSLTDGACSPDPGYLRKTRRATIDESKEMSAWLDAHGVAHVEMIRVPSAAYARRQKALRSR